MYITSGLITTIYIWLGFPGGGSGKEPACQCRIHKRHRFNPWAWKIPWRRAWPPTPVFFPGESHGQRILAGYSLQITRVRHDLVTKPPPPKTYLFVTMKVRRGNFAIHI